MKTNPNIKILLLLLLFSFSNKLIRYDQLLGDRFWAVEETMNE